MILWMSRGHHLCSLMDELSVMNLHTRKKVQMVGVNIVSAKEDI